jgi:hypothetical protein
MRRFFRFSLRDLLWLTLVVALGLGWWASNQRLLVRSQQLEAERDRWQSGAGALEFVLSHEEERKVTWEPSFVKVRNPNGFTRYHLNPPLWKPSPEESQTTNKLDINTSCAHCREPPCVASFDSPSVTCSG